jgi:hypothetical protein
MHRGRVLPEAGNGNGGDPQNAQIKAVIDVPESITSQSRHSLLLQGSPPSGKLLIPLNRRDVRVVEGARLESDCGQAHCAILKHLVAQPIQQLPLTMCSTV